MNDAPGRVNPDNALIPFAQFDTLHFARFVILDDKTLDDVRVYGLPVRTYPLYLAFLGDIDGDPNAFLDELVRSARRRDCARSFSCCEGFAGDTDLVRVDEEHTMRRHRELRELARADGAPHSRRGGVARTRSKSTCESHAPALAGLPPREVLREAAAVRRGGEIRGAPHAVRRASHADRVVDPECCCT